MDELVSTLRKSIETSNAGAYLLLVFAFILFMLVNAVLALTYFFIPDYTMHLAAFFGQILGILGAALLWRKLWGRSAAPRPTYKPTTSALSLLVATAAAIALGMLATVIANLLIESIPFIKQFADDYMKEMSKFFIDATGLAKVLGVVSVCLVAPICEETLFRGTILQEQRKKERVAVAVALNGFLFAAFHFNPFALVGLAVLGAFLAHVTVRSGSLFPAILTHAAVNTTNALIIPALKKQFGAEEADAVTPMSQMLLMILGLAVLGAFLWWLTMRLMPARAEE